MKNKLSITSALVLSMLFGTIILPQTASAETPARLTLKRQTKCVITGNNDLPLRVRATPNGKIIGSLRIGTQVWNYGNYEDNNGDYWAKIKYGRRWGYISVNYISCS